jgi:3-hydroxyisobutyrate dehydrogenase-like beta-hydroxyacid dehydrogenase/aryl-alcohol dehydrogenase-like predicted oxidoreductase
MATIGVIGLGLMGSALADRFRSARLRVVGFDPRDECRQRLAAEGGQPVESVGAVFSAARTVVLSLPSSDAVRAVIEEAGDLVGGATIIDTTTGEPDATEDAGEYLASKGCEYLDATLTGSSERARAGGVIVTAGGPTDVFAKAEPLFGLFAARAFHVGPWGSGARMKLVVNLVLGLNRAALAEGLALARCCGLDLAATLEILQSGAAYSRAMDAKGKKMIDGDFTAQAKLSQHLKDVRLMLAEGDKVGAPLPFSRLHETLLVELADRGLGDWDNSAVLRAFEGKNRPMAFRPLGRTGLKVSAVAFGAGPVSGLMTGTDFAAQLATVQRALERGIHWYDTAPGYGNGASEQNLGRVVTELGVADRFHVATKVRVPPEALDGPSEFVQKSVEESLGRLRVPRVALLQLHNGLTRAREDEPASVTPADALRIGEAMAKVRDAGLVQHVGLTGTGQPEALHAVVRSGCFDTIQVPFSALNPSAGCRDAVGGETDYGNVIAECAAQRMGVFAIRVFAGGALLDQAPSAHTQTTPYFPLALYQRDLERAKELRERIAGRFTPAEFAVRFVLSHAAVSSAIIGFGSPAHVDEVTRARLDEPLPADFLPFGRA